MSAYNSCPDLSFLITFCNQKEFVCQLLDSIINQKTTYSYEILIGVDGNDDGTIKLLDTYCRQYSFIYYYRMKSDVRLISMSRASQNRLFLLSKSNGRYFCVVDGDDFFINENRVENALTFLYSNTSFIGHACCKCTYDSEKKQFIHNNIKSGVIDFKRSVFGEYVHVSQCIFLNIFKLGTVYFDNNFFNDRTLFRFMAKQGDIFISEDYCFAYRVGIESVYSSQNKINKSIMHICANIINGKIGYKLYFNMLAARELEAILNKESFLKADKKILASAAYQEIPLVHEYVKCFSSVGFIHKLRKFRLYARCKIYIMMYNIANLKL